MQTTPKSYLDNLTIVVCMLNVKKGMLGTPTLCWRSLQCCSWQIKTLGDRFSTWGPLPLRAPELSILDYLNPTHLDNKAPITRHSDRNVCGWSRARCFVHCGGNEVCCDEAGLINGSVHFEALSDDTAVYNTMEKKKPFATLEAVPATIIWSSQSLSAHYSILVPRLVQCI